MIKLFSNFHYLTKTKMKPKIWWLQDITRPIRKIAYERFSKEYNLKYLDEKNEINSKIRDKIFCDLNNFKMTIVGHDKKGEVVMSGGVDLVEVDNKTMQSKIVNDLFFCGEVLDVDGFCGGFNLQNCWSTGYIAGMNL